MNDKIKTLIDKARVAQAKIADCTQEQADEMVKVVAKAVWKEKERIAQLCVDDTGKGTYDFKIAKMKNTTSSVYMYLKGRKTVGLVDYDEEKQLWTYAKPVGVIGIITPVTNPAATPIGNGLNVLKTRNAMIVSPHPGAKKATAETVDVMRKALEDAGYPADLCQVVPDGTMEDSADLMASVDLIVATGGPGMVKAAYSSGKPALGVGQGNVQCVLDDYSDLDSMIPQILATRMIDYGMPCTGEQTLHCPKERVQEVVDTYVKNGAYYIDDPDEIEALRKTLFINGQISRDVVGQPAAKVAKMAGIDAPDDTKLLLVKVEKGGEEEVLAKEILCPITRVYAYDTFEEGVEHACINNRMEGSGHSSCIWSNNDEHIQYFAAKTTAGRVMVNAPATTGSGRQNNGLAQTVSLGCGYWGGNGTYRNVNYKEMLNYTIVSKILPDVKVLTPDEIMSELDD